MLRTAFRLRRTRARRRPRSVVAQARLHRLRGAPESQPENGRPVLHAAHERFLKAASKSRSPTGDLVAGDEHGDPLGHPGAGQAAGEPPGFVGGPCSLRRKDSGAVPGPHCPPLPNQSGNPHQEEIRDQAIEQDPRRAEQPPHEAPGDRHGGGQDRRPQQQCAEPAGRAAEEAFHTQPMTQPVTKNRPSPIHISGFTNCSQAVVSPKR